MAAERRLRVAVAVRMSPRSGMRLVAVALLALAPALASCENIVLETPSGSVRGAVWESTPGGLPFAAFLGMPYAKAPVGERRFKRPEPLEKWPPGEAELDATKPADKCSQWTTEILQEAPLHGNEDCLYMNVYVPKSALKDPSKGLPVLVNLHGGAFIIGNGNPAFYGPHHFMDTEEVILVTFNYRVGIFGFLSMEDDTIPGNLGIRDQVVALQWVQDNIEKFQGNKDQVTIFGSSSGGTCVFWHILSPGSAGLFHQGISLSSYVINQPSVTESPSYYGAALAEAVGCDSSLDTEQVLQCLQSKSVEELMEHQAMVEKFALTPNPWRPVVDDYASDAIMPEEPKKLLQEGRFNQVPLLAGTNQDEGAVLMVQFLLQRHLFDEVRDHFDVLGPVLLLGQDEQSVTEEDVSTASLFMAHYTGTVSNMSFTYENRHQLQRMLGHLRYVGPLHTSLELFRDMSSKPVYHYQYRHRGARSMTELDGYDSSLEDLGVCHGDYLLIMFQQEGTDKTPDDLAMSKKLVGLFTRFARSGSPHRNWLPLEAGKPDLEYAVLDTQPIRMEYDDDYRRDMDFFKSMTTLIEHYRDFDFKNHPAYEALQKRHEEAMKEEEGREEL